MPVVPVVAVRRPDPESRPPGRGASPVRVVVILAAAAILVGAGPRTATAPVLPAAPVQEAAPAAVPAPDWVIAYWEQMIGTWLTDNAEYLGENEPWEQYGIDWTWGLGKKSLVGRLYGLRDGRDAGTFWEFREFWHPTEKRLIATQFGSDGTYGAGPQERETDGTLQMIQVFYDPTLGTVSRIGHRLEITEAGAEHVTRSFTVEEDGTRSPRRTYVWRKVK